MNTVCRTQFNRIARFKVATSKTGCRQEKESEEVEQAICRKKEGKCK
jgi:hypothetical protein